MIHRIEKINVISEQNNYIETTYYCGHVTQLNLWNRQDLAKIRAMRNEYGHLY